MLLIIQTGYLPVSDYGQYQPVRAVELKEQLLV